MFKWFTFLTFSYASGTGLFVGMRAMIIFLMSIKTSRHLHEGMISKVMNAPINTFFDVTPTGTIMNRFSKDLQVMDNNIAFIFGGINVMIYQVLAILIVICTTNWYIIGTFPPIIFVSYILFSYTVTAYREGTRIESVTKSPLLNLLSESLNGSSTIRAFGKQNDFISHNNEFLNKNILAKQILMGCWCWYGIRMDIVSIILMASATVICVEFREKENQVLLAMVFSYILQLQGYLINMLYYLGDLEKNMVSVVRCFKILEIP